MEIEKIIDGIIAKKQELGITAQQLADLSGVPKSTVDRFLRRDTASPSLQTTLDLAAAVGYTFGESQPAPAQISQDITDPMLRHVIDLYSKNEQRHAEEMKEQQRHYMMLLAEKNRWIKFLLILCIILVTFVCVLLVYDLTHLDRGWFQMNAAYYSRKAIGEAVIQAVRSWLNI